jgi:tetratricopeptide (TPR) repeat protein
MLKSGTLISAVCVVVTLLLVALLFPHGGAGPVGPGREPASPGPAEQASLLASRGDYREAWALYREALAAAPEDVSLWYALGVTLSHLGERQATEEAFGYVVSRGRSDSEEVKLARRWLVSAGVLAEPVRFKEGPEPTDVPRRGAAAVKGKVAWGEPDPSRSPLRVQVFLEGLDGEARGARFITRVRLGQPYAFEALPAGSYRLTGRVAGERLWELTLAADEGKAVVLNLGKHNSLDPTARLYL